jgi:hypothetical protein
MIPPVGSLWVAVGEALPVWIGGSRKLSFISGVVFLVIGPDVDVGCYTLVMCGGETGSLQDSYFVTARMKRVA